MSEPRGKSFETEANSWVVVIIAVVSFATFVWPNYYRQHHVSSANSCINRLRQIDAAANQFALERMKTTGDAISFPDDLTPYIKLDSAWKIPPCPSGGIYSVKKVGELPTCSLGTTVSPAHVLP
jgi:hypothetical protein